MVPFDAAIMQTITSAAVWQCYIQFEKKKEREKNNKAIIDHLTYTAPCSCSWQLTAFYLPTPFLISAKNNSLQRPAERSAVMTLAYLWQEYDFDHTVDMTRE